MATFNFNIDESSNFTVDILSLVETDCASRYTYRVKATPGNSIRFSLSNGFDNASYTILGVSTVFSSETTVVYQNDLHISFTILNSGTPGIFNSVTTTVIDDTSGLEYEDTSTRENDSLECGKVAGGISYDELTDTPINKTGNALKLVRVSSSEDSLEYVDAGTLGSDLNHTHLQNTSSDIWTIQHNLGKIPSVIVQDGNGNNVHGDVDYIDLNNLTITFNTAFSGKAYFN